MADVVDPSLVKYKSITYLVPPFTVGAIVTLPLNKPTCEIFQKEGFLLALIKKENKPVSKLDDLCKKGLLLKFRDRVLVPGKSGSVVVKSTSEATRFVLSECISEVEVKEFDSQTYIASASVLPVLRSGEIEEKEYKSMLIDKMDKILTKINPENSRVDEYYVIDSLPELTAAVFQFLKSYGALSYAKNISYLEADNLKTRIDILLEAVGNFYFNYSPANTKGSKNTGTQSVESYEDTEKYQNLINRIKSVNDDVKEELRRRLKYFSKLRPESSERASIGEYFETLFQIPWDVYSDPITDLKKMRVDLDTNQFGMQDAKERVLEYLVANLNRGEDSGGKVICLMGSPGTGKTLFAQNVAKILGRKFTSIALGGVDDVTLLRGQRKGWVGAEPGQLVKALIRAKSMNPVIIFDEIDKIGSQRGDQVKAALLEIFDPNQNREFRDAYLDIPIDISRILFITSGNYFSGLPLPLRDRMEIIQIQAYTTPEKIEISKKFTIPQLLAEKHISGEQLQIADTSIDRVVESFKFDAGMRRIKLAYNKIIDKYLLNKYEAKIEVNPDTAFVITPEILPDYVKLRNVESDFFDPATSIVGEINMLWTRSDDTSFTVGGGRSPIQVRFVDGKGEKIITGTLTDVTKQAVAVSYNYLQTKCSELSLAPDYFKKHNMLIHFPSIAVTIDGPSCCTAITLAMISAIKNLPIPQNYGITGEMDLMGNVLPIGGVKTKVICGLQVGLTNFSIPNINKSDFENDVDDDIKKQIQVHFYGHIREAVKIFFPDFDCKL